MASKRKRPTELLSAAKDVDLSELLSPELRDSVPEYGSHNDLITMPKKKGKANKQNRVIVAAPESRQERRKSKSQMKKLAKLEVRMLCCACLDPPIIAAEHACPTCAELLALHQEGV